MADTWNTGADVLVGPAFHKTRNSRWLPLLALCLLFLFIDTRVRLSAIDTVTSLTVDDVPAPVRDTSSLTGYQFQQHRLVLPLASTDGYHWLLQTERMIADGSSRIRYSYADNAPLGREVHWSSALRWWLASVSAVVQRLDPDASAARALEFVAPWAGTLLLALFLLALVPLIARRAGGEAAVVAAVGPIALYPLYQYFAAGIVDHHGLAAICALLSLLFLLTGGAGWIADPGQTGGTSGTPDQRLAAWLADEAAARRWFVAAGIAGGAGMWISAAALLPVLAAIGGGALLITRYVAPPTGPWRPAPRLWHAWAVAGACTSLFFYLLEYAPGPFSLRLEVNHPLYALAWLAGGDLIYGVTSARVRGLSVLRAATSPRALLALAVLAVPAVTILLRGDAFVLTDPFLTRLHLDYILEFQSMLQQPSWWSPWQLVQGSALPLLLLLITLAILMLTRGVAAPARAIIVLGVVPVITMLTAAIVQVRWVGLACALMLALLCAAALLTRTSITTFIWTRAHRRTALLALLLLFVPFPAFTAAFPWRLGYPATLDLYQVVARDVAHMLRLRTAAPLTVLSGPTSTTWLIYFGGFRGIGTLYWENMDGLKAAAAIYAAPTNQAARQLLAARGVTHIVLFSWDAFTTEYVRLASTGAAATSPNDAFATRLLRGAVPAWLRPLPYDVPHVGALRGTRVHIFEVEQPPAQQ